MIKYPYLLNGSLIWPLRPKDNAAMLDSASWNYLRALLAVGDWCYAFIGGTELVEVMDCADINHILLRRGLEGTERRMWVEGDKITFGNSVSQIRDSVDFVGYDVAAVTPMVAGPGTLGYPVPTLVGVGGVTAEGLTVYPVLGAVGCAGPGVNVPPEIPPQYQPYRIIGTGEYRFTDDNEYRQYV